MKTRQGNDRGPAASHVRVDFAGFIRDRHQEILDDWERRLRAKPPARELPRPVLIDHLPQMLEYIGELAQRLRSGEAAQPSHQSVQIHAVTRLKIGFDLDQVVNEFTLLRACIAERWETEHPHDEAPPEMRALHQALDQAIMASVERYTHVQNSALQALDRVSAAALESRSLAHFLHHLLDAVRATLPAADSAAALLLEDGALHVRASIGLAEELETGLVVHLGEGLAGRVAAQKRPLQMAGEKIGASVAADTLRRRGLQALYGLPLIEGHEVIGVVVVGSSTASDFSEQDKFLLDAMANRATAAVVQHTLRELAERRARQQKAVAQLGAFGLSSGEPQQVMERAVVLAARGLRTDATDIEELQDGQRLIVRAQRGGWPAPGSHQALEPGSQAALTLASAQPVIVADYRALPPERHPAPLPSPGIRSGIAAAIRVPGEHSDEAWGLIASYSRTRRTFGRDDAAFLQTIGRIVASAIERRRAADALILSANRFQALLDNSPAAVYLKDLQGRYMVVSRRFHDVIGLDSAAVIGKRDDEVAPAAVAQVLRANDAQVLEARMPMESEEQVPIDGKPHTVLSVKFPLLDTAGQPYALCGISTDITHRLHEKAALQESEERLRLALEVADLGTYDWDLPTGLIHWSSKIRQIFRLPEDAQITQEKRASLIHPQDRDHALDLVKAACDAASGGRYRAEYRVLPVDGSPARWIDARGQVLFDAAGRPRRFIGVAVDITERKHADLERERLLGELQQAVRIRDDLLAIVSHDLRNPLGTVTLSGQLLGLEADARGDARSRKQVDVILRASQRMKQLIDDLLDMANIRTGRLSMDRSAWPAAALVNEAAEVHGPLAAAKGVSLDVRLDIGDESVCCDHGRIQQVFANLVGNAIKFCAEGDTIRLLAAREAGMVRFSVVDSGPGIAPEALDHLFEAYWSAAQHARKGSGLGLSIAHSIVAAHGGRLWVESTVGEGSAFHFTVPIIES